MKILTPLIVLILTFPAQSNVLPQNYLFFNHREKDGANILAAKSLCEQIFVGAQIVYTWRSLEPQKGEYDFTGIEQDLSYLKSIGKRLWIQLQDKSFTPRPNVPDYILVDAAYKGGALKQSMISAPERDPNKPLAEDEYGWSAKVWEKPVRRRFQALIRELGRRFDGKIEGINFSESSIEIGVEKDDGTLFFPEDFNPQVYVDAIAENMEVLRASFKVSTPMVYLNFLPGEWLPHRDLGFMKSLFDKAQKLQMGIGGPDLMPYRKSHMNQTYGFFATYPDALVKAMAVQDGNLRQINPKTGKRNSMDDVLDFSKNYLGLDIIFWVEEEPYFSKEVIPGLRNQISSSVRPVIPNSGCANR